LLAIERFEQADRFHAQDLIVDLAIGKSDSSAVCFSVRYLVKAKLKPGKAAPLLESIDNGSLGRGSIAGDEYLHNMRQARFDSNGVAHWVETCFCDPPLEEERPYWEEFFDLVKVTDAHSRRNCRHENGMNCGRVAIATARSGSKKNSARVAAHFSKTCARKINIEHIDVS
jgi:hypothetical protein